MKRIITTILTLGIAAIICGAAHAGVSQTKSFRMSLTIPAIVGVNVPDPSQALIETTQKRTDLETIQEVTHRDGQQIVLQTTILK